MFSILCDSRCRFFSLELQQLSVSSFINFPMSTNKGILHILFNFDMNLEKKHGLRFYNKKYMGKYFCAEDF
jgi:hypothetical protein